MANTKTNKPFGLSPSRYRNGSPWNGQANLYYVLSSDASVISIGDVVKLAAPDSTHYDSTGLRAVTLAGATDPGVGVVVGISPTFPGYSAKSLQGASLNLEKPWKPASTEAYVWVCDDPDVVFKAQMTNGTLGNAKTLYNCGSLNVNLTAATGGTYVSANTIDATTTATTNSLQFKLLGMVAGPENSGITDLTSTTGDYAVFELMFNIHQLGRATGIAGV